MAARKKTQTSAQALRLFRSLLEELNEKQFPLDAGTLVHHSLVGCAQCDWSEDNASSCITVRIHEALHTPIRDRKPKPIGRYDSSRRHENSSSKA